MAELALAAQPGNLTAKHVRGVDHQQVRVPHVLVQRLPCALHQQGVADLQLAPVGRLAFGEGDD